jgi:hypothetical protein
LCIRRPAGFVKISQDDRYNATSDSWYIFQVPRSKRSCATCTSKDWFAGVTCRFANASAEYDIAAHSVATLRLTAEDSVMLTARRP